MYWNDVFPALSVKAILRLTDTYDVLKFSHVKNRYTVIDSLTDTYDVLKFGFW